MPKDMLVKCILLHDLHILSILTLHNMLFLLGTLIPYLFLLLMALFLNYPFIIFLLSKDF